jgi:transcription antitermination factor NusB
MADQDQNSTSGQVSGQADAQSSAPVSTHHDSANDPRHQRRIATMQQLFAYSFYTDQELIQKFLTENADLQPLIAQTAQLDIEIQKHAPERPLHDINKVDLAILRSIVFEWKSSQVPKKVLINEAIELAKEFGTESSPRFVNGVLAKLLNEEKPAEELSR